MCPDHRKRVIKNIRDDLSAKRKILVSSTQLIEAGVDFDFPVVFRALAPLESIIQAAGRCNRENNLGPSGGKVFLFKMHDSAMPDKTYSACANHAEEFIKLDLEQLHNPNTFNRYYAQVVNLYVNPDQYNINQARKDFNFQTVNDSYRIIRDSTEGLYMYNYSDESRRLFHSIEHKEFLSRMITGKCKCLQFLFTGISSLKIVQIAKPCPRDLWFGMAITINKRASQ